MANLGPGGDDSIYVGEFDTYEDLRKFFKDTYGLDDIPVGGFSWRVKEDEGEVVKLAKRVFYGE